MNIDNEGLLLWYGTPDAPAPGEGGVTSRRGATVRMAVRPANPSNVAIVRYRVDGGIVQTVPGRELGVDSDRDAQHFEARFPEFVTGEVVEYQPIVTCGGRQVPAARAANEFSSRFRLARAAARLPSPAKAAAPAAGQRWADNLEFLARVSVEFRAPEYVCETADGMRVNFFVERGTLEFAEDKTTKREGLRGSVVRDSADHLLIRPDGMGEIRIRAVFETADGAVFDVESGGYADFGPGAYELARARRLPDCAKLVVTPLIRTRHPKYKWLSRVQCVGVGLTHLDACKAWYEVHVASTRPLR